MCLITDSEYLVVFLCAKLKFWTEIVIKKRRNSAMRNENVGLYQCVDLLCNYLELFFVVNTVRQLISDWYNKIINMRIVINMIIITWLLGHVATFKRASAVDVSCPSVSNYTKLKMVGFEAGFDIWKFFKHLFFISHSVSHILSLLKFVGFCDCIKHLHSFLICCYFLKSGRFMSLETLLDDDQLPDCRHLSTCCSGEELSHVADVRRKYFLCISIG